MRAHLLPQQVLALLLIHFGTRFGIDLVAQLQNLDFVRQVSMHAPQSFRARIGFEQRLFFL